MTLSSVSLFVSVLRPMNNVHSAYLGFPSSDLAEVPGFFEADFKPAKKPVGFVILWLALVFTAAESATVDFVETFASTFTDGFADFAGAVKFDPFEISPEIFFTSSDCSRLMLLWSLGVFEATPLG